MTKIYNFFDNKLVSQNNPLNEVIKNKEAFFRLNAQEKYNYDLIKNIFLIFEKDLEYLKRVYEDIEKNIEEYWMIEFSLRMLELLEGENNKEIALCNYICNPELHYLKENKGKISEINQTITLKVNEIMDKLNDILAESHIQAGRGFIFISDTFNYSKIIIDYFAKKFISQIFLEWDIEKQLHRKYNNYEEFEQENPNVKKYIIDQISLQDSALVNYIILHFEIIEEAQYVFQYIKNNWENYTLNKKNLKDKGIEVTIGYNSLEKIPEKKNKIINFNLKRERNLKNSKQ